MGVSGCGKSSVGERLAIALGCPYVEGDSLHPVKNVEKMSKGIPLNDEDRWPWLDEIGRRLGAGRQEGIVISCSALKKIYRDRLRAFSDGRLAFVFLEGSRAVLESRMKSRTGHFMPASLLDSQLSTLESPSAEPGVITVDIDGPLDGIVDTALSGLEKLE